MNSRYDISVVVVTYKAEWRKLKLTLLSILMQKDVSFEIVVSDDGSSDNHRERIEHLFLDYGFSDYKLDLHDQNQGTVKNLLSGYLLAESEYVKDIGQGDLLYDEHTLRDMLQYAKEKDADAVFGDAVLVDMDADELSCISMPAVPYLADIYDDKEKVKKAFLLNMDRPYGCTPITRRDVFIEYLERACGHIVYGEDLMFDVMAAESRKMAFLAKPVTVYDYGARFGERTAFNERLEKDVRASEEMIETVLANDPVLDKRRAVVALRYEDNRIKRVLKECMIPDVLRFKVYRKLHPRKKKDRLPAWLIQMMKEGNGICDSKIAE